MSEIKDYTSSKSYDLVTENLVQIALRADKGEDAELLSFDIKPFTSKGDNYSSVVANVKVRYWESESEHEGSYVAKLNPLRPVSSFSDITNDVFILETEVFSSIIGGMNKELEKVNFPPIKTPKLFARCLDKENEAFLTENLREQGFKMYDRRRGMDMNHVKLVCEELGRFHASSFLFEQTLLPKTIPEAFKVFKDFFNDNTESFKMFDVMMVSLTENACRCLKEAGPKYERCEKWLYDHRNKISRHYIDGFKPHDFFDVLIHGDCWTNNMLFKYDEDHIPVDLRLLDLQCSRKGSPAADLNYFFYSSLNGDIRQKNMDSMLSSYYDSFAKVINSAGKTPPFSYEELLKELRSRNKMLFALGCAILILLPVFAEGDEICEFNNFTEENAEEFMKIQSEKFAKMSKKQTFRNRFLAVFDDMMDNNIFGHDYCD